MSFRRIFGEIRRLLLMKLDPFERWHMARMRRTGSLVSIKDLIPEFTGSTFFAFATGGSLSNLNRPERVKNHNVMMLTTAPIHFFKMYGVMPNLWLIHNPASVRMAISTINSYGLSGKIDFSNTVVLVPDNGSKSKVKFSDISMRRLRKIIGKTRYALYTESRYSGIETVADFASGNAVPKNYLQTGNEPIELMNGSSVEAIFLPFLAYLGVKEIYFGGVDHRDTGHFWDRNDPWHEEDGTPKSFDDTALVEASGNAAIRVANQQNISVHRLEADMTALTHYDLVDFEDALERSTNRQSTHTTSENSL